MMNITLDGYVCPKCGYKKEANLDVINIRRTDSKPAPVYTGGGV